MPTSPEVKPEEDHSADEGMTFWEHLEELRSRMFRMAIAVLLGSTGAWFYRTHILAWLLAPFEQGWLEHFPDKPTIHFPDPAGMFIAYLKLAMVAGCIFALPIIFYQVWAFVAPGLYAKEKKFAIPFVAASTLLFCGGAYFGMTLVFPAAFGFLLGIAGPDPALGVDIKPTIMVGEYVTFIVRLLLAFGTVFELPIVVFFLSIAGVVNHRHLIKFFRYFIVIAFIIGALITPPDLLSQFLLALPLIVLYVISIGIAWLFARKREASKTDTVKDAQSS